MQQQQEEPEKKKKRGKKVPDWVKVVEGDAYTYPTVGEPLELVFKPGVLYKHALWYRHAFGVRRGISSVYLPLLDKTYPIAFLESWRRSPYA